jgi:hypothetical protein
MELLLLLVTLHCYFSWFSMVLFGLLVVIASAWSSHDGALFALVGLTPSPPSLALLFVGLFFALLLFLKFHVILLFFLVYLC